MRNALLKFLYFIVIVSCVNSSYAADNQENFYSVEKSWIDIPSGNFILNITKDKKLNELTNQYHQIEKRRLENFHHRIKILNKISQYIKANLAKNSSNLLLNKFDKMVKRKAWYLEKIIKLYSLPRKEIVRIFSKIGNHDNEKNILYLRNSVEFDFKLPTYWGMFALEMIDPCRRMLTPQYHKWINNYIDEYPHFFAWLEGEEITFRTPQTKVLSNEEIKICKTKFLKGIMYYVYSNKLVHTEDNLEYIYVITLSGEIFITKSSDSIKHTSLSRGKPILGAGSIKVNNGQISYISNESGHYRPEAHILQKVLSLLEKKHKVNISNISVNYYYNGNVIDEKLYDFINKKFDQSEIKNVNLLYSFKY